MRRLARAFGVALLASSSCSDRPSAPPLPAALIVVDTDLPAPLVASRLRVDLYAEDGTWFDSSDIARPSAADWPASFGVYTEDESRERLVWVRLRIHPEGRTTDYRGERFRDWTAPFDTRGGDGNPRLMKDGKDVTPPTEPQPLATVDRLVLVRLKPEKRGRARILLHGACIGTMPRLGDAGVPVVGVSETCTESEKGRQVVTETPLEEGDLTTPKESAQGTWLAEPCLPAKPDSRYVCVPGGATILGSAENTPFVTQKSGILDSIPVRVFGLHRFWIDRNEMSVARYRSLVASGRAATITGVIVNDGPLTGLQQPGTCTWSRNPLEREDFAMTCIEWKRALTTCNAIGGDLPTEAQWEHVATLAGYPSKVSYPWGDDPPGCQRAVYGRKPEPDVGAACGDLGLGPHAIASGPGANDVSSLGIVGLAGGVQEYTRDDYVPFTAGCWRDTSIVDPGCSSASPSQLSVRGATWSSPMLRMSFRIGAPAIPSTDDVGFRCVYKNDPEAP